MKRGKRIKKNSFKDLLSRYIAIKGLDIIILLKDGVEIELKKNRKIVGNEIIIIEKGLVENRIPISNIQSADFYAA